MADKHKRFEGDGVICKAKLIGAELVMEPRGDKMCQNSIQRLKAIIKGTNSHKKRIVLKISYDGVKVFDEKTNELLYHHEVSQISYIASDDTDSRTFGYVSDVPSKAHQFICFKTSGPAITIMSLVSALFEAVLEKKKHTPNSRLIDGKDDTNKFSTTKILDLISDSKTVEGKHSSAPQSTFQPKWTTLLENSIVSPTSSFSSTYNIGNVTSKQSVGNDLIFDDLFTNLTGPIIVDKNDSLISYKSENAPLQTVSPIDVAHGSFRSVHDYATGPLSANSTSNVANEYVRASSVVPRLTRRIVSRKQGGSQQGILLPPPSSLPKPAITTSSKPHNRSLVYNHSSVSLGDATLTRQTSFGGSTVAQQNSFVDRYAAFNDIDNLPSIFESTSLGSVSNFPETAHLEPLSKSMVASSVTTGCTTLTANNNMFRRTNPFDDDFFA